MNEQLSKNRTRRGRGIPLRAVGGPDGVRAVVPAVFLDPAEARELAVKLSAAADVAEAAILAEGEGR